MTTPAEPCRTCDGLGYTETAAQDSRVIHYEPCPDCGGPVAAVVTDRLVRALVAEYVDLMARRGHWRRPWSGYYGGAEHALERVAERLGVTDLHARAAAVVARGETGEEGHDG